MSTRPIYRYNEVTGSLRPTVNRELGIAVQFQSSGVFKSTYTTKDVTKNQLINYILTNPGERFFNPNYGAGVKQYLFENIDDLSVIEDKIADGISKYVQNIIVNSVNAFQKDNNIYITIDYSINNINDQLTLELEANE